ncbi:hypothetical protein GDO78_016168 [Eleutherodactylus coqui]|uniref:Reverse transcriptase domain-containing protein n=1 Tax=Eleutherodactylus coqui TaxID=57060 RepID=A0A8J6BNS9_ELECQ|nr:hypothetical protein GDO78_016168 [Eleutherodactylus coqui]
MLEGITVDPETLLVTLDVESLYSSIPHIGGIQATQFFLEQRGLQFSQHSHHVLEFLSFVLTHNYFLFDTKYFHQLRGTAMGTSCAPSYANLYLGWWEEKFVYTNSEWSDKIILWLRFIDDILILWGGVPKHLFKVSSIH